MAAFPVLKTKAVAQYPASKTIEFRNQALRFVDGTEQRYRDAASALHRWTIRLNELDENEMAAMESFFLTNQGQAGSFSFTDPWDGTVYANCALGSDAMEIEADGEMRAKTTLTVIEVRS